MNKWHHRFLDLAEYVAQWSKDSTKVGAVIVGPDKEVRSLGYNGFPRGIDDHIEARHKRPTKYFWSSHAEENAILNATRASIPIKGCTLYVQWFPCSTCSRAIIQSGLKTLVCPELDLDKQDKKWQEEFKISREMLEEARIAILFLRRSNNGT